MTTLPDSAALIGGPGASLWLAALAGAVLVALSIALWSRLCGFAAQRPADYSRSAETEAFDIRRHLDGQLDCFGVIYGPFGRVRSRFHARFDARWTGSTGVIREHFRYDSGAEQDREWHISLGNDGRILATAPDVEGAAAGQQSGPALQMRYRLRLPEDAGGHVLNAIDWMYLTPGGAIVNRSQFRKFGLPVAELVATLRRVDAA